MPCRSPCAYPHLQPTSLDITKLIPRVERREFAKALFDEVRSKNEPVPQIFISDLAGGIFFTYAFQFDDDYNWASSAHLSQLGVSPEDALPLALDNLKTLIPKVLTETDGNLGRIAIPGTLASSTLLIFPFWDQIENAMKGPVAVAAPTHDSLWYCDASCTDSISAMKTASGDAYASATNELRLTNAILSYANKAWTEH